MDLSLGKSFSQRHFALDTLPTGNMGSSEAVGMKELVDNRIKALEERLIANQIFFHISQNNHKKSMSNIQKWQKNIEESLQKLINDVIQFNNPNLTDYEPKLESRMNEIISKEREKIIISLQAKRKTLKELSQKISKNNTTLYDLLSYTQSLVLNFQNEEMDSLIDAIEKIQDNQNNVIKSF